MSFVEIRRDVIETVLKDHGFRRDDVRGEITYSRLHHASTLGQPLLSVKVFTSVPEFDTAGRACGEDAIRVVGLLTWTRSGESIARHKKLYSKRVYRTGSSDAVMTRMVDRMREAYAALNQFRKERR